ncbi:MAG: hypothetical protein R6U17_05065 [Thermoplasmata archaeon]
MIRKSITKTMIVLISTLLILGYSMMPTASEIPMDEVDEFIGFVEEAASYRGPTFIKVEGYEPWAALVVNAGDPAGVDAVTVTFEDGVLRIEATDSNSTNHATILINKDFADEYLDDSEGNLDISVSDAVNYQGTDNSNASAGHGAVYVFHIEHFSTQWIEMTAMSPPNDFEPPVDGGQAYADEAENAAAYGAATFLKVEGYEPWAALVVNAGDPRGVDAVAISFEDDILRIEATDSNSTNHVTILINKAFADRHLADAEGNLDISVSDAVNYQGMENSNASAGHAAVYVFHIQHFSTQWVEIKAEDNGIPHPGILVTMAAMITAAVFTYKRRKR